MEMLIRTVFFFLLYLKCCIIYRKQVYFRGFSVVCYERFKYPFLQQRRA